MLWPRYINLWEHRINSWEHDMSWPRDAMLREQHPFLMATTFYVKGTTYLSRSYEFNL